MRKAIQKQRGKKKPGGKDDFSPTAANQTNGSDHGSVSSSTHSASSSGGGGGGERRKATPEEAVLTAKNYRMAKELSELRVRHREETKNVTRLTMENMNLASRCREAISHVAMLKKELSVQQRRSAKALETQRQQVQRSASSMSAASEKASAADAEGPATTEMAVEMDRMDRLLAEKSPPPPPPVKALAPSPNEVRAGAKPKATANGVANAAAEPTEENDNDELGDLIASVTADNDDAFRTATTTRLDEKREKNDEEAADLVDEFVGGDQSPEDAFLRRPDSIFPNSASPKPAIKSMRHPPGDYDEGFPDDLLKAKDHPSSRFRGHTSPGIMETADEGSSSSLSEEKLPSRKKGASSSSTSKLTMSSIDVFEASFDTAFPSSFSSSKDSAEGDPPTNSASGSTPAGEIYNPFFPSPQKSTDRNKLLKENPRVGMKERSPAKRDPPAKSIASSPMAARQPETTAKNSAATPPLRKSPASYLATSPPATRAKAATPERDDKSRRKRTSESPGVQADSPASAKSGGQGSPAAFRNAVRSIRSNSQKLFPKSGAPPPPPPPSPPPDSPPPVEPKTAASPSAAASVQTASKPDPAERSPSATPEKTPKEKPADAVEAPRTPAKAVSKTARARYEKALQPRQYPNPSRPVGRLGELNKYLEETSETGNDDGSPSRKSGRGSAEKNQSAVLKRLQQRRVKERIAGDDSSVSSTKSKETKPKEALSMSESRRRLAERINARAAAAAADKDMFSPSDEEDSVPKRPERKPFDSEEGVATKQPTDRNSFNQASSRPRQPAREDELMGKPDSYRSNTRQKSPTPSPPSSVPSYRSPSDRTKEMKELDSMVSSEYRSTPSPTSDAANARFSGGKSRRNVRHPISYAEPSLSSKLRQGDVFFPMSDSNKTTGTESSPPLVSPEGDSPNLTRGNNGKEVLANPVQS